MLGSSCDHSSGNETKPAVAFQVIYCDQTCQKTHWFAHKKVCKQLKDMCEKQRLEAAKEKSPKKNSMYMNPEPVLLVMGGKGWLSWRQLRAQGWMLRGDVFSLC